MKIIYIIFTILSIGGCNPTRSDGLVPVPGASTKTGIAPSSPSPEVSKQVSPQPVQSSTDGLVPVPGPSTMKRIETISVLKKSEATPRKADAQSKSTVSADTKK